MSTQQELAVRLDAIRERLDSLDFLNNRGLGNEIGFYIFDYPPQYELMVREYLTMTVSKMAKLGRRFVHLNLFEELVDMLNERKLLDKAFELEKKKGTDEINGRPQNRG